MYIYIYTYIYTYICVCIYIIFDTYISQEARRGTCRQTQFRHGRWIFLFFLQAHPPCRCHPVCGWYVTLERTHSVYKELHRSRTCIGIVRVQERAGALYRVVFPQAHRAHLVILIIRAEPAKRLPVAWHTDISYLDQLRGRGGWLFRHEPAFKALRFRPEIRRHASHVKLWHVRSRSHSDSCQDLRGLLHSSAGRRAGLETGILGIAVGTGPWL